MEHSIEIREDRQVKMSLKILYAVIASAIFSAFTASGLYFKGEGRNDIQDLQYQVLKLQVDKLDIDMKEMKKEISNKEDRK